MIKKLLISGTIVAAAAGPAFAQGSATPRGSEASADPNETVCRVVTDTGSRLSRSRVCMTREQWAEQRRTTRQSVERSQTTHIERTSY